jgi:hypothetical protein
VVGTLRLLEMGAEERTDRVDIEVALENMVEDRDTKVDMADRHRRRMVGILREAAIMEATGEVLLPITQASSLTEI